MWSTASASAKQAMAKAAWAGTASAAAATTRAVALASAKPATPATERLAAKLAAAPAKQASAVAPTALSEGLPVAPLPVASAAAAATPAVVPGGVPLNWNAACELTDESLANKLCRPIIVWRRFRALGLQSALQSKTALPSTRWSAPGAAESAKGSCNMLPGSQARVDKFSSAAPAAVAAAVAVKQAATDSKAVLRAAPLPRAGEALAGHTSSVRAARSPVASSPEASAVASVATASGSTGSAAEPSLADAVRAAAAAAAAEATGEAAGACAVEAAAKEAASVETEAAQMFALATEVRRLRPALAGQAGAAAARLMEAVAGPTADPAAPGPATPSSGEAGSASAQTAAELRTPTVLGAALAASVAACRCGRRNSCNLGRRGDGSRVVRMGVLGELFAELRLAAETQRGWNKL